MGDFTEILGEMAEGGPGSSDQLFSLVYDELRQLATANIRNEKPGLSLQATALVHEAYLRLLGGESEPEWNSRGHFFAAAGEAMRRILVERARSRRTLKRGGAYQRITVGVEQFSNVEPDEKILELNDALEKLESIDELRALVVKLRFFVGLTIEDTAQSLGISTSTVDRYWTFAKAWLQREMSSRG